MADKYISQITPLGSSTTYLLKDKKAIENITRSGTTFTATRRDGTTFTFTQQDNNSVTGVKGNAETNYRTGNVNLTLTNIIGNNAIGTGSGGTGNTSFTSSRLIYSETATKLASGTIISEGDTITFNQSADIGLIKNTYNNTVYNVIRNHNNGNISVSASSVGLYLGYENTTIINFLSSKGAWDSTGLGIGTTSPSYKLHVVGNSYFSGNTTHNGIDYFANGTTYQINNAADGYLRDLKVRTLGIAQTDGDSCYGISLYGGPVTSKPTYGLLFAHTSQLGKHGDVSSDWATYFTMSNHIYRGWIFQRGTINVASISGRGYIYSGGTDNAYEGQIHAVSGAGDIYLYSQTTATGTRGIYTPAHGTGPAHYVISVNTNNLPTYYGGQLMYRSLPNKTDHALALKDEFDNNKADIPRAQQISYYDTVSSNGSMAMGYFIAGHNTDPYGGFFVAHYNNPYYVGIQSGTYTQQHILTSTNYTSYTVKKDGTGASGTWGISITGNAATATNIAWTGVTGKPATTLVTDTGTSTISLAYGGKYKLTAAGSSVIFTMPASDNTNTASAVDNILDGSNSGTAITYAPYTSQQTKLSFDTSTTNPSRTDRLNLNGHLYATKFIGPLQGNADTATALATAGTIKVDLASTSAVTYTSGGNITPGVTGSLGTANGGTGNTSFTASRLIYSETATKLASGNIVTEGNYLSNITYLSINADHQINYRLYAQGLANFNIAADNAYGIGGHRLNAIFEGTNHASILIATPTNNHAYGIAVNQNGNMYVGYRNTGSYTSSSGDKYLLILNSTQLYPNTDLEMNLGLSNKRWKDIYGGNFTYNGTIYFGDGLTTSKPILAYSTTYPYFGIYYWNESTDVIAIDGHGKSNSKTEADLAINALGAGIISTRNRYIPHTNNTTGTVGTATKPVYVNTGTITEGTYELKATVNSGTANQVAYYSANNAISSTSLSVSDPTASGSGITYIASISQNSIGKITATKSTVRDASASQSGVVSTGAQTFAGNKTFNDSLVINANKNYPFYTNDNTFFVNKAVNWNSTGYYEWVYLLIPVLTATNQSAMNYIDGTFHLWKTGGNVYDNVHVNLNCCYNTLEYYLESYGQGTDWKLVRCTYNGIQYYALKGYYHANPYTHVTFTGHVRSDLAGGNNTSTKPLNLPYAVAYYNYTSNSANAVVLNSEIKNSLTDTLTNTYVTNVSRRGLSNPGGFIGNATTATTLQTARTINGTSFNGSADITTANWGTARTLTIGATGKSVNGSGNVSWSMNEIMGSSDSTKFYRGDKTWSNTLTGDFNLSSTDKYIYFSDSGTNTRGIRFQMGTNDYGRLVAGATAANGGWLELATADDGNEPIYIRQYTGTFTTITRTLTLLDASGNTTFPGTIYVHPTLGAYREGIRIYPYGSWATIVLGGNDLTAESGTSANSWSIHNNNGTFYLTKNGSNSQVNGGLSHSGSTWTMIGTTSTVANATAWSILTLGNGNDVTTTNAHSQGLLRLYSKGTKYIDIQNLNITNNRSIYFQAYDSNQYLIHAGDANAIGNTTTPAYIAANGRATVGYPYLRYINSTDVTTYSLEELGKTASIAYIRGTDAETTAGGNGLPTGHMVYLSAGIGHMGTPFQIGIHDSNNLYIYKRWYSSNAWSTWTKMNAGNADTATAFSSNATVTLTGDTTGTSAGSTKSWTVNTTTNQLTPIMSPIGSGTTNHGVALKNYFDSNKSSTPRNKLINFYSSTSSNGSQYFGYFLAGHDTDPYGGFFVAHYNQPWYVGISGGTYTQYALVKSSAAMSISQGTANRLAYYSAAGTISSGNIVSDGNYISKVTYLSVNEDHQTGYNLEVNGSTNHKGNIFMQEATAKQTAPSSDQARYIFFHDKDAYNNYHAYIGSIHTTSNEHRLYLATYSSGSSGTAGGCVQLMLISTNAGDHYIRADRRLIFNQTASQRDAGIYGVYDYKKAAAIWSMGDAYKIAADGSSFGTLYGAAYGYGGQSYMGNNGYAGGHQFLWCANGTINVALGTNLWNRNTIMVSSDANVQTAIGTNNVGSFIYNNGIMKLNSAAAAWTYLRLHNGSNLWDIATRSDQRSGALQFRPAGSERIWINTTGEVVTNLTTATTFYTGTVNNAGVFNIRANTIGTTSATGLTYMTIGNTGANNTASNSTGRLYLGKKGAAWHVFLGENDNASTSWHYLPDSSGWVATGGNGTTTGVGSASQPVYLSASGVLTACTSYGSATDIRAKTVNINNDTSTKLYVLGATTTGYTDIYRESSVTMENNVLKGAAWNDYAEYRQAKNNSNISAGKVVYENGNDTLSISTQRLMRGCNIVSDTYGFAIGESEKAQLPIAVSGRVLAYPYESREEFKNHIGWPVCSGPNGTVSIMTEEEEMKYPSRIIGTISAVPDYEIWHGGTDIVVDGRVWIKVK